MPAGSSLSRDWMSAEFVPGLVSIIVPAYNRSSLLKNAIASVAAQDYRPIECIVIDDGSTEDIRNLVEDLIPSMAPALHLRYLWQNRSGGCAARNRGLKESQGEFIGFLDSDDELLPEAIQRKVERLKLSEASYCYDRGLRVDEQGNEIGFFGLDWPSDGPIIWRYLFDTNAPLLRRSVCRTTGPWNESLRGNQEVEYFARLIIAAGRGDFISEVGHKVLEHGGSRIVGSSGFHQSRLQAWELIWLHLLKDGKNYRKDYEIYSKFISEAFSIAANGSYLDKDYQAAYENLSKACRYGYQRWHVKLYLSLFPYLPGSLLSRAYFFPKLAIPRITRRLAALVFSRYSRA